jgi:hypothetical protein
VGVGAFLRLNTVKLSDRQGIDGMGVSAFLCLNTMKLGNAWGICRVGVSAVRNGNDSRS